MTQHNDSKLGTDNVFVPGPGRIFVFGSNTEGHHGAGAARTAYLKYGAVWKKGEGLYPNNENPQSYGLPTCWTSPSSGIEPLPFDHIKIYVERFLYVASMREDLTFFVTRIGCGLAGYKDAEIAPLFKHAPANCELPPGWREFNA